MLKLHFASNYLLSNIHFSCVCVGGAIFSGRHHTCHKRPAPHNHPNSIIKKYWCPRKILSNEQNKGKQPQQWKPYECEWKWSLLMKSAVPKVFESDLGHMQKVRPFITVLRMWYNDLWRPNCKIRKYYKIAEGKDIISRIVRFCKTHFLRKSQIRSGES